MSFESYHYTDRNHPTYVTPRCARNLIQHGFARQVEHAEDGEEDSPNGFVRHIHPLPRWKPKQPSPEALYGDKDTRP